MVRDPRVRSEAGGSWPVLAPGPPSAPPGVPRSPVYPEDGEGRARPCVLSCLMGEGSWSLVRGPGPLVYREEEDTEFPDGGRAAATDGPLASGEQAAGVALTVLVCGSPTRRRHPLLLGAPNGPDPETPGCGPLRVWRTILGVVLWTLARFVHRVLPGRPRRPCALVRGFTTASTGVTMPPVMLVTGLSQQRHRERLVHAPLRGGTGCRHLRRWRARVRASESSRPGRAAGGATPARGAAAGLAWPRGPPS